MADCPQINNTTIIGTSAVSYDSTPLPCTDVKAGDDLNTILTKFDNVICSAINSVNILTEEVMNITEDLMIIGEEIENINDQIFICCPICDFTITATELPVCDFTGSVNQVPDPTTTTTSSSSTTSTSSSSTTTSTTTVAEPTTTTTSSSSTSTTTSTSTSTSSSTTTTTTTVCPFCPSSVFSPRSTQYYWKGLTTTPDGTVYGCTLNGFVWQYPVGGPWSTLTPAGQYGINSALAGDSLGNVYGARLNEGLYIKLSGNSFFIPFISSVGYGPWTGLFVDQDDTLWALQFNGSILKKAVSTTTFVFHANSIGGARDITVAPNGDVYVCTNSFMLKQTGGVGAFVPLPTSPGYWTSISAAPNGDIICVGEAGFPPYVGGAWVIYAGTNTFVKLPCASDSDWESVHAIAGCKFYAGQANGGGSGSGADGQVHIFG
jgi:hypothetical protein